MLFVFKRDRELARSEGWALNGNARSGRKIFTVRAAVSDFSSTLERRCARACGLFPYYSRPMSPNRPERLKANTVERPLTAISQAHQLAGYPNPVEDQLVRNHDGRHPPGEVS